MTRRTRVLICPTCQAEMPNGYLRHDLKAHDGLERARELHAWFCARTDDCVCAIEEYEQLAREAERRIDGALGEAALGHSLSDRGLGDVPGD